MAFRGGQRKFWMGRPRRQWSRAAESSHPSPDEDDGQDWPGEEMYDDEGVESSWRSEVPSQPYCVEEGGAEDWETVGDWDQSEKSSDGWHRGWQWDPQWGWYKLWHEDHPVEEVMHTWAAPKVEDTTMADNGRWYGRRDSSKTSSTRDDECQEFRGRPTEKMQVPEFNGEGTESDLGQSARSYLRRVQAWLTVTKMSERERPIALYSHLTGRAWVAAEELSVDRLTGPDGIQYYMDWVRIRFMEIEITKVANVMSELFRKCRKRSDQPVREFNLEYERLLLRLRELECELPPLVKAWLYMDKLRMSETEEMSLLSSVNNKFDLKLLQQAALIHDRTVRRAAPAWERSDKRWGKQSVHVTGNAMDEESEDEPLMAGGAESDDELVTEEVALTYHEAYVAFQDAKSRYKEAIKGRGADPAELKKRSEARLALAKARSYCGACKRKGHWHKDPECPLRQNSNAKDSQVKSVQLCHVYMVGTLESQSPVVEEVMAVQPRGCPALHAIADTACSKSVAGHQWYQEYCTLADSKGIPVEVIDETEKFKFGASRVHTSTFSVWARFSIAQKCFAVKIAVVPCRVPLLISRTVLAKLQMVYHCGEHRADFKQLGIENLKLGLSDMGHPTLDVTDFDGSFVPAIPIEDSFWGSDPDVRIPKTREAYMCELPVKPLFYPKKVSPTVQSMLEGKTMSRVAFYRWWKDAKMSKDFWIETEDEIIRIHVVPRGGLFDPSAWNTSLLELKGELVACLDGRRVTEALQVVGMESVLHVQDDVDWRHASETVVGKHLGPWIGRSRFSWHRPSTLSKRSAVANAPHSSSSTVAMGDEETSTGGGAAGPGDRGASQMDSAGAACYACGATSSPEPQEHQLCHEGHHPTHAARAHQEVRGSSGAIAGKANSRIADQVVEGLLTVNRGTSPDVRQVEELDVQGDSGGVHALGCPGDEGKSQFIGRTGAIRKLVQPGVDSPRDGVQEASQGELPLGGSRGEGSGGTPGLGCARLGLDRVIGASKERLRAQELLPAEVQGITCDVSPVQTDTNRCGRGDGHGWSSTVGGGCQGDPRGKGEVGGSEAEAQGEGRLSQWSKQVKSWVDHWRKGDGGDSRGVFHVDDGEGDYEHPPRDEVPKTHLASAGSAPDVLEVSSENDTSCLGEVWHGQW